MITGLLSCNKESLIVEKDDSLAVMDVAIHTTSFQTKPSDIRYTSAGWMIFQESQSPYVNRMDTMGNLISQADVDIKGIEYYGEMLVEDELGVMFRCANLKDDPTKLLIQELDVNYAVTNETEVLVTPEGLRVTGFKYAGAGSFVFSVESANASISAKIYFYEGMSKTLILLAESKRGILIDYIKTSKGYQYLAVESYFSGVALSILILDNGGQFIREIGVPDYFRTYHLHPQGRFRQQNESTQFVYTSKLLINAIVMNDHTNQLVQASATFELPHNNSRLTLLDFQFSPSGRVWALFRDDNNMLSRNLYLSEFAINGRKLWSRTLNGTKDIDGICRLRLYDTKTFGEAKWQILAASSRYESLPLSLISPK
ncbi:MAG: hypothetical protein ACYC1Q_08230 [Bacteroidia bacterium]